jgi:tRNA threonylcarbamoyladenosine biosynthesis protein TsaB
VGGHLILAIESATGCGSVSLSRGGIRDFRLLAECITHPDSMPSRRLLGSVEWVMRTLRMEWRSLDAIGVSMGPGSFTGLRTGLAAAKAIAMATGKPVVGVPTLEGLAVGSGLRECLVCAVLDARKEEVYRAFYWMNADGMPRSLGEPAVVPPAKLLQDTEEAAVLFGPGVTSYQEIFSANEEAVVHPGHLMQPRASWIGLLASERLDRGQVDDPVTLAPRYVRVPEAEINLRRKQQNQ